MLTHFHSLAWQIASKRQFISMLLLFATILIALLFAGAPVLADGGAGGGGVCVGC